MYKMIIDTHIHLQDKMYQNILDDIISENIENNILACCVSVDCKTSQEAIRLFKDSKNIFPLVGIHAQNTKDQDVLFIEKLLKENKGIIKGIGEIGLDLHWEENEPIDIQIDYFKKQLDLSIKYNLPVSIHVRDSMQIALDILKEYKNKIRGVIHCFQGTIEDANKVVEYGLSIGVGGIITYKNADSLRDVIKQVLIDNIVLETDGPYLSPQPVRKNINRSSYIEYVAEEIAKLKNIKKEEVLDITSNNAKRIFNL